ncbi:MAG TPA: type II toxin-antitoxin system RelE/ParE family toxin [bacterium]|jgi:proteic killer suppression protein|nr:type II toxin-antitoxin system RelE/ParE family toxin [bacterium]
MIHSIADKLTQDVFDGVNSKAARRFPTELHRKARHKLDLLNAAGALVDLRVPPGNQLEALKGDLKGYFSIRINDQWRVIFKWVENNAEEVRITDYH